MRLAPTFEIKSKDKLHYEITNKLNGLQYIISKKVNKIEDVVEYYEQYGEVIDLTKNEVRS